MSRFGLLTFIKVLIDMIDLPNRDRKMLADQHVAFQDGLCIGAVVSSVWRLASGGWVLAGVSSDTTMTDDGSF